MYKFILGKFGISQIYWLVLLIVSGDTFWDFSIVCHQHEVDRN